MKVYVAISVNEGSVDSKAFSSPDEALAFLATRIKKECREVMQFDDEENTDVYDIIKLLNANKFKDAFDTYNSNPKFKTLFLKEVNI